MATESRSTRLNTAYALLDAYGSLSPDNILSLLDDSCTHQGLPESLGLPVRNKTEFRGHATGITNVFSTFAMIPLAVFEDEENNAVAFHVRMEGMPKKAEMGQWVNEGIVMLRFTADGTKITQIKEFVDSAKAKEMMAKHKPKNFASHGSSPLAIAGWALSSTVPVALAGAAFLYFTGRRDVLRWR